MVNLSKNTYSGLIALCKLLDSKDNLNWAVVGSLGLALQGVDIEPNDIDILSDKNGAKKIDRRLIKYASHPLTYKVTKDTRLYNGIYRLNQVQIELLAEPEYLNTNNEWEKGTVLKNLNSVVFEGFSLKVPTLESELEAYKKYHKFKKVEKIERRLKEI